MRIDLSGKVAVVTGASRGIGACIVEAALAQDYPKLEVLLSDDCSTDGTFEILQEVARTYGGPHRVCAIRTPHNLHIGGHMSFATGEASGEFIVISGGDDLSLPHRTRRLVDEWLKTGKRAARNPWGGSSLEWQAPSPPPLFNFEKPPVITEPYDYSELVQVEEYRWERRPAGSTAPTAAATSAPASDQHELATATTTDEPGPTATAVEPATDKKEGDQ